MKITEIKIGMRVAYIPLHAGGNLNHPDVERGRVRSMNDKYAFVVFDRQATKLGFEGATAPSCDPKDLIELQ